MVSGMEVRILRRAGYYRPLPGGSITAGNNRPYKMRNSSAYLPG